MPPIEQLQRLPPYHLDALLRQGIFTTGLLLEVSETPTRRQYLADQIGSTTNDVNEWRDEALLLNLANFGPAEQALFTQAELVGLADVLALPLDEFAARLRRAARALGVEMPPDLIVEGWWDQAHTLREE
jgi:DNA-directed RNA polymerase specialized sigma24 family protein